MTIYNITLFFASVVLIYIYLKELIFDIRNRIFTFFSITHQFAHILNMTIVLISIFFQFTKFQIECYVNYLIFLLAYSVYYHLSSHSFDLSKKRYNLRQVD